MRKPLTQAQFENMSFFMQMIAVGDVESVKAIFQSSSYEQKKQLLKEVSPHGLPPQLLCVHSAKEERTSEYWEIFELLVAEGVDPNEREGLNRNALMIAAESGWVGGYRLLQEKYERLLTPYHRDSFGKNIFHVALEHGQYHFVQFLFSELDHDPWMELDNNKQTPLELLLQAKEETLCNIVLANLVVDLSSILLVSPELEQEKALFALIDELHKDVKKIWEEFPKLDSVHKQRLLSWRHNGFTLLERCLLQTNAAAATFLICEGAEPIFNPKGEYSKEREEDNAHSLLIHALMRTYYLTGKGNPKIIDEFWKEAASSKFLFFSATSSSMDFFAYRERSKYSCWPDFCILLEGLLDGHVLGDSSHGWETFADLRLNVTAEGNLKPLSEEQRIGNKQRAVIMLDLVERYSDDEMAGVMAKRYPHLQRKLLAELTGLDESLLTMKGFQALTFQAMKIQRDKISDLSVRNQELTHTAATTMHQGETVVRIFTPHYEKPASPPPPTVIEDPVQQIQDLETDIRKLTLSLGGGKTSSH